MPMIATTTNSSMSVKPFDLLRFTFMFRITLSPSLSWVFYYRVFG
jgi:hypothetical protein